MVSAKKTAKEVLDQANAEAEKIKGDAQAQVQEIMKEATVRRTPSSAIPTVRLSGKKSS